MKKFLFLALCLTGCTSLPPSPPSPVACNIEGNCQQESGYAAYANGLGPDRTVQVTPFSPTLIGGVPADAALWPASVYARAGSSACSATIVGDRVVFIASHCVADGGSITFTAHANSYRAVCSHHPEYRGNSTADWTLCLVDRPVTGVAFEVLGVEKAGLLIGQDLLLSGYGCIHPGGGGGNDGIFRIGNAKIRGLPYGKNYDIVTKGGAALCFGDSGGSAYLLGDKGARYIVAVNSRGDISTVSYLPAVFNRTFGEWASIWAKNSNNVRICGLHSDALGCRQGQAEPQPDGKFEVTSKAACVKGAVNSDYLWKKSEIVEGVRKALDSF